MKVRTIFKATAAATLFWLLPETASADNCGSFNDCYSTVRAATAATAGVGVLAVLTSLGLDFIPGLGDLKGIWEAITGRDAVTQERLRGWERALGAIPIIGRVGKGVKGLGKVGRALI